MNANPSSAAAPAWRFDHVNVSIGSGDALRRLFESVMGLAPDYRPPFPFPGVWLYEGDQAVVHAVNDPAIPAQSNEVRFGHVAFRSEEPASRVIQRLRSTALPFRVARIPGESIAQIFVSLPGDFVVELDVPDDDTALSDYEYGAARAAPRSSDF